MNKKRGFLLIEVMIAIALITLVISFGFFTQSHLHKALVRSDLEKLHSLCLYLQRLAMVTNQKQSLLFDCSRNCYSYNGNEQKLSPYALFGTLKTIKGPPSTPIHTITKPITFAQQRITFNPNGILQPGTIYITDNNKQHQFALTVPVSQISFLRKYHYDGKWHPIP